MSDTKPLDLPSVRPIDPFERRFYAVCRAITVGLSHLVFVGGVIGREHIPDSGPFILAPIHRSYVDWLISARVSRRRLRYLVKGEVWRVRAMGRLLELLGAFPVQRGAADRDALRRALQVLAAGEPLVVFPEGTRGFGSAVPDIREGAAYLALRGQVPVIPVGMAGVERAMPRGTKLPRPTRVVVAVGKPIMTAVRKSEQSTGPLRVRRNETAALTEEIRLGIEQAQATAESHLRRRH